MKLWFYTEILNIRNEVALTRKCFGLKAIIKENVLWSFQVFSDLKKKLIFTFILNLIK